MDNLISVIIPVYNREKFIRRAIESIILQDHTEKEIIVVDDGSTDKSAQIAEEVLKSSKVHHKIISLTKNSGVSHARNVGIQESQGTYISFLDSDDYCDTTMLSSMFSQSAQNDGGIADLVFCGYRKLYVNNGTVEICALNDKHINNAPSAEIAVRRIFNKFEPALSSLFRRELLIQNNIFFHENCYAGEDGEFFLKAIVRSERIAAVSSAPYIYVQHETMGMHECDAPKSIGRYNNNTLALARTAGNILANTENPRLRNAARYYLLPMALQRLISHEAMRGNKEAFYRMIKERKYRQKILSSCRMIFIEPEIFLKSLALLAFPEIYYRHYFKKYR
ncbi:MAG: glycosyltransferase family A protein [bacterium]|nr:glycosyltransferase family A protein [bacterium]